MSRSRPEGPAVGGGVGNRGVGNGGVGGGTATTAPGLVALACPVCGVPLDVDEESEIFPCRRCGGAFGLADDALVRCPVFSVRATTAVAVPPSPRYVAVWRFVARVVVHERRTGAGATAEVWPSIERVAAPAPAYLFAPSFTLTRVAVQQLGVLLTELQPRLELTPGIPAEHPEHHPSSARAGGPPSGPGPTGGYAAAVAEAGLAAGPGFGTVSPVVFGEADARSVAHFVYLALESHRTPELRSIEYELDLDEGTLLYVPALYDPRHVRHANWRLLLAECDTFAG